MAPRPERILKRSSLIFSRGGRHDHGVNRELLGAGLLAAETPDADVVDGVHRGNVALRQGLHGLRYRQVIGAGPLAFPALLAMPGQGLEIRRQDRFLLARGRDGAGDPDGDLPHLSRVQDQHAGQFSRLQVGDDLIRRILRPVGQAQAVLFRSGDEGSQDFPRLREQVGAHALLVDHDDVGNPAADVPGLVRHGSDDLCARGVARSVDGCAADAGHFDLPRQVVIFEVVDDVDRRQHIVPDDQNDGFRFIDRAHAEVDQRGLRVRLRVVERRDLGDVGDFHADVIQHARVEHLGLEVDAIAFLPGVRRGEQAGDPSFDIVQHIRQIAQLFRLDPAYEPRDRRFDFDGMSADVERIIDPVFFR